ncbi:MAG: di-heme oxidoredictase family protein [Rhodothermaceae bacterium]
MKKPEIINVSNINKFLILVSALMLVLIVACTDISDPDVLTPSGRVADPRALSADDFTIFTSSSTAFDTPSNTVIGEFFNRFMEGDRLYEQPRVTSPAPIPGTGGLGPLYVGFSCTSCHNNAGRSKSTLFTHGGTGNGFSSQLVFLKSRNGQYFPSYGRVLHDQATGGVKPEGRINVTYTEEHFTFPDGEPYSLITPRYFITDWYAEEIPDEDLVLSVRTPLRHVGLGLMMAVDQDEILSIAANQYPEYGISGEVVWCYERGERMMGLSGHKAQHGDLTVELGFSSDMGVTNDRFPYEVGKNQPQDTHDFGIEISTEDMADVELYLHSLGVPARRDINDPVVKLGEEKFNEAKCNLCHVPTLHTSPEPIKLMDGTRLPYLANKTIHPYSDFLVHDMGPGLADNYDQYNASGSEWRTTPLWGIGLQQTVSGHTHFLHDGRARNFVEAIMWHKGGEADVSYQIFRKMKKSDRDAIVRFLKSL